MQQNIEKLGELDQVIKECVTIQNEKLIRKVPESEVKKMYDIDDERDDKFGAALLDKKPKPQLEIREEENEEEESIATATEDKIFTESLYSNEELNYELEVGNIINPIVVDKNRLARQMPSLMKARDLVTVKTPPNLKQDSDSDIETYKQKKSPMRKEGRLRANTEMNLILKEAKVQEIALQMAAGDNSAIEVNNSQLESPNNADDRSESTFRGDNTIMKGSTRLMDIADRKKKQA